MRLSIASAQVGRLAEPAAVKALALAAEAVGYRALWALDRLPAAVAPRSGYGGIPGNPLPVEQQRVLDPFTVLATAAAVTDRVRVGTSVAVAPWYPPALLARALTSLDVLSEGRLVVGLGSGWSLDEYEAAGADFAHRGPDLDEALDVLDAHWSDGPVAHEGRRARIAPAHNRLRPVQRPRPPVLLAAYTPAALARVARRADGWMPASLPPSAVGPMWAQVRDLAATHGRDPEALELVVRANVALTDRPLGDDRLCFTGSLGQVAEDVVATGEVGAHEVILALGGDPGLDETLDAYARIAEAVGVRV